MKSFSKGILAVCACCSATAFFLLMPSLHAEAKGSGTGAVGAHPGGIGLPGERGLRPKLGDQLAAFSGGCFWGTENSFRHVAGVVATAVGFTGGSVANPSYEEVCTHTTGHAETVLVEFNPNKVTYKQLLAAFWKMHDPTTVDRQGPDLGDNYRSAIWCYDDKELTEAQASKKAAQKSFSSPVVTQISRAMPFYMAEEYHQQYDEKTGTESCPTPTRGG
jgi:peptide-methionine (S)-S-oxide reductase